MITSQQDALVLEFIVSLLVRMQRTRIILKPFEAEPTFMVAPQKAQLRQRDHVVFSTHHAIHVLTPGMKGLTTLAFKPDRPYGILATTHQPPILLPKLPLVSSLQLMKKHSALAKACNYRAKPSPDTLASQAE